jgi:predicted HAD superfamily phosphohydrolase
MNRWLITLLLIATTLGMSILHAVPIVSRDQFYNDLIDRTSGLIGIPRNQINARTPLALLEANHPELRRELVEYTRERFFPVSETRLDETSLDGYETFEQATDFLYQFVESIDDQAQGQAI